MQTSTMPLLLLMLPSRFLFSNWQTHVDEFYLASALGLRPKVDLATELANLVD